jgi:hypothetical protein
MWLSRGSAAVLLAGLMAAVLGCAPRQVADPDCVAAGCSGSSHSAPASAAVTPGELRIDFSRPDTGAWAPNGFLHSTQSYSSADPAFTLLRDELQIGAWRLGGEAVADTTARAGIRTTLLLYDVWKRDRRNAWPFHDLPGFERWLGPIVHRNRDRPIIWEIWNEWDIGLPWWGGTEADLLATYARADRAIRSIAGPEALVAGPSYYRFDRERFRTFAEYCLAHGCQANVFTWHELRDQGADQIAAHVRWVTDSIATNPRYAALRIRQVDVNEILSRSERYSTGDLVVALRGLHDGGGAYFARSCWREATNGEYECLNGSYDGIIDTLTRRPRAAWWVHAAYAHLRRDAVTVQAPSTAAAIAGFLRSDHRVGAILATGTGTTDSLLQFTLRGVTAIAPAGTALSITAYSLPWRQGDCPLPRPEVILRRTLAPVDGELRFELPALARGSQVTAGGERIAGRGAYLITISDSSAARRGPLLGKAQFPPGPPCPLTPARTP